MFLRIKYNHHFHLTAQTDTVEHRVAYNSLALTSNSIKTDARSFRLYLRSLAKGEKTRGSLLKRKSSDCCILRNREEVLRKPEAKELNF
jgi:hypothetical protein